MKVCLPLTWIVGHLEGYVLCIVKVLYVFDGEGRWGLGWGVYYRSVCRNSCRLSKCANSGTNGNNVIF